MPPNISTVVTSGRRDPRAAVTVPSVPDPHAAPPTTKDWPLPALPPITRMTARNAAKSDGPSRDSPPSDAFPSDTQPVEKMREWFGTPVAAGKTLIWLCWVWLLISLMVGLLYLLAVGALALFT
jgi:hypothetical protein